MEKIIIIPNKKRDSSLSFTKDAVNMFSKDFAVCMPKDFEGLENAGFYENDRLFSCGAKLIISLGGDGTILTTASAMLPNCIPILGVNLGHLGFLTELEYSELKNYYNDIVSGNYKIENRMMIEASIIRNNQTAGTFYALNDIVIARGALSRILHITTAIDDCKLNSFNADGIIFSTPTGSTAYSLSAGGPIIAPEIEAILVNAISPHNMSARPIVIPPDKCLKVNAFDCSESHAYLSADGRHGINLLNGDLITIKKSLYKTLLLRLKNSNFYETVRKKLNQRGI